MKNYFLIIFAVLVAYAPVIAWALPPRVSFRRQVTTSGVESPTNADIIAWWNLDNNGNDASANARNMSAQGATSYTTAKVGTHSLLLDNTNEWLYIEDAAWMTPAGAFTICGWHRPDDATPTFNVGLFSQLGNDNVEKSYGVLLLTTGVIRFSVFTSGGASGAGASSTTAASNATWFFYCGVFEPSTSVKTYFNGVLEGTNTTSVPATANNAAGTGTEAQLRIGSYNSESTNSSLGRHDSIGFFNRALTADEITWLYNSGNGRQYSDL